MEFQQQESSLLFSAERTEQIKLQADQSQLVQYPQFLNIPQIVQESSYIKIQDQPYANANTQNQYLQDQIVNQSLQFNFPILLLNYTTIAGRSQFKKMLEIQHNMHPQYGRFLTISVLKLKIGNFPYIRCRLCKAKIKYKANPENTVWTLIQFDNKHVHPITQKNTYQRIAQKVIASNINLSNQQSYDKLRLSNTISYSSLGKIKKQMQKYLKYPSFEMIQNILHHLSYEFKYQHNPSNKSKDGFPDMMVAVSQKNKESYRKYGQILSFNIFYQAIQERSFQGKEFGLGIFTGFDLNNELILFGFSISCSETIQDYKKIMKFFFQLIGGIKTQSIITQIDDDNLMKALQQLRQEKLGKYSCILDNAMYLRRFKEKIKNLQKKNQIKIFSLLRKLIRQTNPKIGKKNVIQLLELLRYFELKDLILQIEADLPKICLWAMSPQHFVGILRNTNESKLSELLQIKQQQTTIFMCIQKFQKYMQQTEMNKKMNIQTFQFETLYDDEKIYQIRKVVEWKVFTHFIQQYQKSECYLFEKQQKSIYYIKNSFDNLVYRVQGTYCECSLIQKIGIPCEHLIFVAKLQQSIQQQAQEIEFDFVYLSLFNERWLQKQNLNIVISDEEQQLGRSKRDKRISLRKRRL